MKTENSAKYRFTLTSIRHPRYCLTNKPIHCDGRYSESCIRSRVKCIGFARRRRGRGGRIVLDRISTNMDEFWANLDYTIYSGSTKLTAKEICRQNEVKRLQQQESIIRDKSQSIVIDLEPSNLPRASSGFTPQANSSDDKMENIVIKTEEKTAVTVNENLETVNRTKTNSASRTIGKHFDFKRNDVNTTTTTLDAITNRNSGTVNIINTDNNNNSGNNSNSSDSNKNNNNNNNINSSTSNANNRLSNTNNTIRLPSNTSGHLRRHLDSAHPSTFGSSPSSTSDNVVDASDLASSIFQRNNNSVHSKT